MKDKEVFELKDLIPYQDGRIVNLDLLSSPKMKFVVMSFDEGTGLSEHSAPGTALVFALDGRAIIGYEGKSTPSAPARTFASKRMDGTTSRRTAGSRWPCCWSWNEPVK